MDNSNIHYLSTNKINITPFYILEMKQKFEESKLQLKQDLEFIEKLVENNLIKVYIKSIYER